MSKSQLFRIKPRNVLAEGLVGTGRGSHAYFGMGKDDEILGEGTDLVAFEEENVVAEIEQRPVVTMFLETALVIGQLVLGGDGDDLNAVLPLAMEIVEGLELMAYRGLAPFDKLKHHHGILEIGELDGVAVGIGQVEIGSICPLGETVEAFQSVGSHGFDGL